MKTSNTAASRRNEMKIAGYLSDSDRQILKDHAETLRRQGTKAANKELERMNKMYSQYGMSFGKLKGV